MPNVIAILSGKGGVGKTTLAVNLAMALHSLGEEVVALDGDAKNPNFSLHLGIFDHDITVQDVLERDISIFEAIHIHDSGLRFIPAGLSLSYLGIDSTKLKKAIKELKGHIILDSPPGLSEDVISVLQASNEIIVVTNPYLSDISDSIRLIEVAKDMNKRVIGIVVNKAKESKYAFNNAEIEAITGFPIIGSIKYDKDVLKSVALKKPIINLKPYSQPSIEITRIAHKLIGRKYNPPRFLTFKRIFSRKDSKK